jgi:hypothetical protein
MGNIHTFDSHVRARYGVIDASIDAATLVTAEFVDMANYDLVVFQAVASNVTSASYLTLQIWQATATDGSGSATLATPATEISTSTHATHVHILTAQVRGEDLSSGYRYVGAKLAANASVAAPCAIVINQMRARYKQATLPA